MRQTKHTGGSLRSEVQLPYRWTMLGVHGQQLGTVGSLSVDLENGRVAYLVLETQWQRLHIPWQQVYVEQEDSGRLRFKLRSR